MAYEMTFSTMALTLLACVSAQIENNLLFQRAFTGPLLTVVSMAPKIFVSWFANGLMGYCFPPCFRIIAFLVSSC